MFKRGPGWNRDRASFLPLAVGGSIPPFRCPACNALFARREPQAAFINDPNFVRIRQLELLPNRRLPRA
jgi:hypothetical protein